MDAQHDGLDYQLYVNHKEFEILKSGGVLTAPLVGYSGLTHGKEARLSATNEVPYLARAHHSRTRGLLEDLEVDIALRIMDEWGTNSIIIAPFDGIADSRVRVVLRP